MGRLGLAGLMMLGACAHQNDKMPWSYSRTSYPVAQTAPRVSSSEHEASPSQDQTSTVAATKEIPRTQAPFLWPVALRGINSLFGERRDPITGRSRFHSGVDLDADYGDLVFASATGKVIDAGWRGASGRYVELEHPDGMVTHYAHLAQVLVRVGDEVRQGFAVGRVGNSGRSTGAHLHFGMKVDGQNVDPLEYLEGAPAPVPHPRQIIASTPNTASVGSTEP